MGNADIIVEDLQCEADDVARLSTPENNNNNKKTRGPFKCYALDRHVADNGRHTILINKYGAPVLSSDGAVAYHRYIGVLIQDRVPMLWAKWKDVPMCVKESLNNAISAWFDIPPSLYILGVMRSSPPSTNLGKMSCIYFGRLGVDTGTLVLYHSNTGNMSGIGFASVLTIPTISTTNIKNKTNQGLLTEHHSLGSRSLACVAHEAITSDQVENAFVYVAKKYIHKILTNEKVRTESKTILTQIAREQFPNLAEMDLPAAIDMIDQFDPYVRSQIDTQI
ncbi:Proteasome subunit beta type-3 [Orobanche minor]